jgi:hypothetical protein
VRGFAGFSQELEERLDDALILLLMQGVCRVICRVYMTKVLWGRSFRLNVA